jgi:predicted O-methyltransferase YrrM
MSKPATTAALPPAYPPPLPPLAYPTAGVPAVDQYLSTGYGSVVGMSSRFAAAITAALLKLQTDMGIKGPVAEIGTFEGRFFIAMAHALAPGEKALGIDLFDWPNPQVIDRFEANCLRHGVDPARKITWKTDSRTMRPDDILAKLGGEKLRLFHIDGEHSRDALTKDLDRAVAVMRPDGIIVLDDMLHPGYPTLMVAVHEWLARNDDWCVLAVIDRETIVAATKFVLCRKDWFKRYEERMLEVFKDHIWPLGADFEPHWCLVLALDTRLAAIT